MKIILTSMYANPVHVGHLTMLELAKGLGDQLWVIINNDKQAELKRGMKSFQDEQFRMRIVGALKPVDKVILSIDTNAAVCNSIRMCFDQISKLYENPEITFAKGGDKFCNEIPERFLCAELGIKMIDGLGEKTHNSSDYIAIKHLNE